MEDFSNRIFIYEPTVASDLVDFERGNGVIDTLIIFGADITRYNLNDSKKEFTTRKIV